MVTKWEKLHYTNGEETCRMKVPGGWIVKHAEWNFAETDSGSQAVALVFIADPQHEWTIEQEAA